MTTRSLAFGLASLVWIGLASPVQAQVDYGKVGPWDQRAESGPDAKVPGWFYNLGVTGLRAQLVAEESKALLIKYVFPKSPADGHVKVGDFIVGAGGQIFKEKHRNGYGEKVFGADGPISELANVLEECQSGDRKGKLALTLRRGKEIVEVELDVGQKYGTYSATFPDRCKKSDKILAELLQYLVDRQAKDGSFGDPVQNTFAPLALLASGEAKYLPAVERNARYHCGVTKTKDLGLINWSYMSAAIVLGEYYLATDEKWVLPDLQTVHDRIAKSQYLDMSQIDPKSKKSHPDSYPKGPKDSHGGWGHNPGFEGYGPIAMLTGQGALAYSLMHRCGIKVERKNHDAAYEFLKKGTGKNGYVWYGDQVGGGPDGWADMGRTGAAGVANFLSPYAEPAYRERATAHAKVIGQHPQSFPDTHGSPAMGMAYTALAAGVDPDSFRKLLDANRWWFTMAQCNDGSFHYQPNRDNSGYGSDSRMTASSVVAFIFLDPQTHFGDDGKGNTGERQKQARQGLHPRGAVEHGGARRRESRPEAKRRQGEPRTRRERPGHRREVQAPPRQGRQVGRARRCLDSLPRPQGQTHRRATGGMSTCIGPELGFGCVIGDAFDEPVLLVKLAWGGKSLGKDFRPPSSGGEVGPFYKEIVDRSKAVRR